MVKLPASARDFWVRWGPRANGLLRDRFFLSCAVHGILCFVALNAWWFGAKRMKPAGSAHGVAVMLNAGAIQAVFKPASQPKPAELKQVKVRTSLLKTPQVQPAEAAPAAEAHGDGPATILYIQAFPTQPPPMPSGALVRDLIVDVQIDETGHVRQTHREHGMGGSVDDVIVATLEQWVFQPAMKSGKAIPSVQELHFHFDASSKPGCGWECIQLLAN